MPPRLRIIALSLLLPLLLSHNVLEAIQQSSHLEGLCFPSNTAAASSSTSSSMDEAESIARISSMVWERSSQWSVKQLPSLDMDLLSAILHERDDELAPQPSLHPNQGSLVVFNLDQAVSSAALGEICQAFGGVKEVWETLSKPHKFMEFFDIRDAARALSELDGEEIFGRRLVVEFSRLGSQTRSNSYYKRSSSHPKNLALLPPRLLRTTSEPSRESSSGRCRPAFVLLTGH